MNTNSALEKRDKKHLVGNPPKSTILGSIQSWFRRLPMAVFKNGTYERNHYIVEPIGRKGFIKKLGVIPIYYVGDKIEWKIKVKPFASNSLPLREFDIYEDVPPFDLKKLESHKNLKDDELEFIFDKERILSQKGEVTYWLGLPGKSNSRILISAEVIPNEHKHWKRIDFWGYAISAILGGVAGAIVAFCLK
jgi:hypothetical protein